MSLTNAQIAELAARASAQLEGNKQKALRRIARRALTWPEEVAVMVEGNQPLTSLRGIGPWVERTLLEWLQDPPDVPEPAEIRSGFLSYPEVKAVLSEDLSWRRDLRGDLQMHSVYSDGTVPIEEMARGAAALGHEYVAITDHSKGLAIAGGIDESRLAEQRAEIDALNEDFERDNRPVRILRSLEMNLNPAGEGDMDPDALGQLDLVLGSFHSQLRKKEDQTERYLAALENPDIHVLGHPRGRIYNHRVGLHADWEVVFRRAAEVGKAVEVDCFPDRQDLGVELLELAAGTDVLVSIGTDSHHPDELAFIDFGAATAKLAGMPRERILNYMKVQELLDWAGSIST
ncbi:MAG TPA: PHP domain-containing protein [Actinomycetota bacterium]|nr:PHP domain-containing protein [Actinomycetota bacterium]